MGPWITLEGQRLLDNVKEDLDAGNAGLDAVEQYAGFGTPKLTGRIGNSSLGIVPCVRFGLIYTGVDQSGPYIVFVEH